MATQSVAEVDDPVLAAAHHAPVVQGTPEELAAFEEGLVDIRAGRTVTAEQIRARLEARGDE
jgi:predicted transcriptional regulator